MANLKAAFMSSARTFFILKKWDKAAIEFEKIIESFGEDGLIQEQLSICYANLGNIAKQKECLLKAIKVTTKPDKLVLLEEKLSKINNGN